MNTGKEDAHPLSAIEFAAKFRGLLGGSENSGCKSHFGERLTTAFPANSVQVPWSIANRVDAGRRIKNFFAGKISLQDSLRREFAIFGAVGLASEASRLHLLASGVCC